MATTNFVDGVTYIVASWLNDVDHVVYAIIPTLAPINAPTFTTSITGPYLNTTALNGNSYSLECTSYNGATAVGSGLAFKTARGTSSVPVASATSDVLSSLDFYGHTGAVFNECGSITCVATGNYSPSSTPSRLDIKLTPSGSTTPTVAASIDPSGQITYKITKYTANGDQVVRSTGAAAIYREGSWDTTASGSMYTLFGSLVSKYWSHNTALDANGNFLGCDTTGTANVSGVLANNWSVTYAAPSTGVGVVPAWNTTPIQRLNLQTGDMAVSGSLSSTNLSGHNRITNGSCSIDQISLGASVTPAATGFVIDMWNFVTTQASKVAFQQNQAAYVMPSGASDYLGATTSTAVTAVATDNFALRTAIEGVNWKDMQWGTVAAVPCSISFLFRSSLTGTFSGSIQNYAGTRSYPFTFTIAAANTWTAIKIENIAGDTSGSWVTSNAGAVYLNFDLGSGANFRGAAGAWAAANYTGVTGAVSMIATLAADIALTNVQVEPGALATAFRRKSYNEDLLACQRYLPAFLSTAAGGAFGSGGAISTTDTRITVPFSVPARVPPTGISASAAGTFGVLSGVGVSGTATGITFASATAISGMVDIVTTAGSPTLVAGQWGSGWTVGTSTQLRFTGAQI